MTFRPWQNWESDMIRRHYPKGGAERVSQHVPNRTLASIARQAGKLGVKRLAWRGCNQSGDWHITPDEINRRAESVRSNRQQ